MLRRPATSSACGYRRLEGRFCASRQQRRTISCSGAPDTIRTCDLHLRRVALYPAELRVHLLLLTQCLRGFLAGVKRSTLVSQVLEFQISFKLLFYTNWVDTSLRRARFTPQRRETRPSQKCRWPRRRGGVRTSVRMRLMPRLGPAPSR